VKDILEALRKELDAPKIVATGGDAAWIVSGMQEVIAVDADLTLHGLRLVGNMA
jgi:type III pantothenate kinase